MQVMPTYGSADNSHLFKQLEKDVVQITVHTATLSLTPDDVFPVLAGSEKEMREEDVMQMKLFDIAKPVIDDFCKRAPNLPDTIQRIVNGMGQKKLPLIFSFPASPKVWHLLHDLAVLVLKKIGHDTGFAQFIFPTLLQKITKKKLTNLLAQVKRSAPEVLSYYLRKDKEEDLSYQQALMLQVKVRDNDKDMEFYPRHFYTEMQLQVAQDVYDSVLPPLMELHPHLLHEIDGIQAHGAKGEPKFAPSDLEDFFILTNLADTLMIYMEIESNLHDKMRKYFLLFLLINVDKKDFESAKNKMIKEYRQYYAVYLPVTLTQPFKDFLANWPKYFSQSAPAPRELRDYKGA